MKGFASSYLTKQQLPKTTITYPLSEHTGFIIVIPVLCEPDLTETLSSLWKCDRPRRQTEVIIVINSSENAPAEILNCNRRTMLMAENWIAGHKDDSMRFFIMNELLPDKDAGVGFARKIGMDEALRRFNETGKSNGYILSFDADSTCDPNYLTAIEELVEKKPETKGFDIYFEHPLSGNGFTPGIYDSIAQYELHLRYINLYINHTGFPFASHTIGSCFGVRADIYAAQGGMNRRKGGEDFYFLHKVIPLGNFEHITNTCVFPSPRDSFRVPFGTGPVIRKLMETGKMLETYDPEAFRILRKFFNLIPEFYKADPERIKSLTDNLPESILKFLRINDYLDAIESVNCNSASHETFLNRFFRWFDAFRIIKYLNFTALEFYPKKPVTNAVEDLLGDLGMQIPEKKDALELLYLLRRIEKDRA